MTDPVDTGEISGEDQVPFRYRGLRKRRRMDIDPSIIYKNIYMVRNIVEYAQQAFLAGNVGFQITNSMLRSLLSGRFHNRINWLAGC